MRKFGAGADGGRGLGASQVLLELSLAEGSVDEEEGERALEEQVPF